MGDMSFCRLDACSYIARFYKKEIDTTKKVENEPFISSAVVNILGSFGTVSALSGSIRTKQTKALFTHLASKGVLKVFWERHRKDGSIKIVEIDLTRHKETTNA